ncbi:class I SAM-dependent methyltransferase [Streptomyces sp. NPDC005395]|uniref:class I SAM-dependent methyltransferase n=1 Tax=Streptomyces sp. NPDC005395 TaxID=3157042 RepID=UPI0033B2501E
MSTPLTREQLLQTHFDAFHTARAKSPFVSRLYAEALGDAYPAEVAAYSSCDWPLLGTLVGRLCLRPGQVLADLGCGTGGVGLWLARALDVHLLGVDISPAAVRLAEARAARFVSTARAVFTVGTLDATGLPDGQVHGAVCVDALSHATDRDTALHEIHRILAPGGRAVFTRVVRIDACEDWTDRAAGAGLRVEHVDERPDEPSMWHRLYELWLHHEPGLRQELGDAQADNMLREAHRMLPVLNERRALVMTLQRPPDSPDRVA